MFPYNDLGLDPLDVITEWVNKLGEAENHLTAFSSLFLSKGGKDSKSDR